ncbi:MAG: hypothetical protein ACYC35_16250 [Pirellulales bacterium]
MAYIFSANPRDPATQPAPETRLRYHAPIPAKRDDPDFFIVVNAWAKLPKFRKLAILRIIRLATAKAARAGRTEATRGAAR